MLLLFGGWFHVSYRANDLTLCISTVSVVSCAALCNELYTVQSNIDQMCFVQLFSLIYVLSHLTGLSVALTKKLGRM